MQRPTKIKQTNKANKRKMLEFLINNYDGIHFEMECRKKTTKNQQFNLFAGPNQRDESQRTFVKREQQ